MEYRKLADSDLELSVITFGSWAVGSWMWGKTERNDAIGAIRTAYELGVTSIDTAPVYGQGDSEEIVGEAIRGIPRDKIQILTKFGMRWDVKKGTFASPAMALANKVLPVPGGPTIKIPFGILPPRFWNFFGSRKKSTTSPTSSFASSQPATSAKVTLIWS